MSTKTSKNPSQNKVHQQPPPVQKPLNPVNSGPWTFGYPQCVNKQQSRLVCLHEDCKKYPFFCSSCEDQSCQNQHQHKDRITSIGFKQLIKRLITEKGASNDLQKSIKSYKQKLQDLLVNVTEFVKNQNKSVDQILKKAGELEEDQQATIKKLKDKKYQEIKGGQLDKVWKKVAPTEEKKKLEKQTIEFIDSKRVEVQELTKNFKDGVDVNKQEKTTNTKPVQKPKAPK